MASEEKNDDLLTTINSLDMGVVVVDANLDVQLINKAFYKIWNTAEDAFNLGDNFRRLIDINRENNIYEVADEEWEDYIATRLDEVKTGNVAPRDFARADGVHLVYSVTNLADERRLICYFDITGQKQNETALEQAREDIKKHETRLLEAIESIGDGFVIFDDEDRLVVFNDAFKQQFGEGAKFLVPGKTYREMTTELVNSGIIPVEKGKENAFVESLIEKRRSEEGVDKTFKTHDGKWIKQRDRRTTSGNLVGLRTNVTELKEHEEELIENQELMNTILLASENAFLVTDKDENIIRYNEYFLNILSSSRELFEKCQTLSCVFGVLYDQKGVKPLHKVDMSKDEFLKFAHELYRNASKKPQVLMLVDGRYLRYRVRNIGDDHIVHSYVDITSETENLKKVELREKEIEETSLLLSDTTNSMAQGMAVFEDGALKFFNPALLDLLNVPETQMYIGQTYREFLTTLNRCGHYGEGDEAEEVIKTNLELLESRKRHAVQRKAPNEKFLQVDVIPNGENGNVITYTDITEIKQRELEVEEASHLLNETTNASQQGLLVLGSENIEFFNPKALEMLGVPEEHMAVGKPWRKFFEYQRDRGDFGEGEEGQKFFEKILANFNNGEIEKVERRGAGDRQLLADRIPNSLGGLTITFTDITEIREQQEKLELAKREAEKASALQKSTSNAMAQGLIVFRNERLEMFNPKAMALLQLPEDILKEGQKLETFLSYKRDNGYYGEGQCAQDKYEDILKNIRARKNYNFEHQTKSGGTLQIDGVCEGTDQLILTYSDISGLKKHQADLEVAKEKAERASELQINTSNAMAQGLIVFTDESLEYMNPKAVEMLSLPEDVLFVGQKLEKYFAFQRDKGYYGEGQIGQDFYEDILHKARNGIDYQVERVTEIGKVLRVNGVSDGKGQLVLTFSDITDIRQREQKLQETTGKLENVISELDDNKERFKAFAEANSDWFWEMDAELRFIHFSDGFEPSTGVHPNEFVGKKRTEVATQGVDVEDLAQHLDDLENHRPFRDFTYMREIKDGKTVWLAVSGNPIFDRKGNFRGYLGSGRNVTEQIERKHELQKAKASLEQAVADNEQQKERFKAFAEANTDWFWEMDSELRFSYFSETFESVSGVEPEKLLGKTRREMSIPDIEPALYQQHIDDLENHRPFRDFTHARTRPDGTVVWLAISANPVYDRHGNFEGYVGSGRDATAQVLKQKELEEAMNAAESAERAKSEFLANMSHEIRTPMNGVMGMAELLATTELDSKQKMFTDVIVKSGASLLTIINDILDFSKIDAGQMELDPAPFNLPEAIEDVATLVSAKVAEKDLELIVRVNPHLPNTMIGDVGRIRQIVTNLLGNAVKFTEKGHIYVNVDGTVDEKGHANLKFIVEDTGIGIPPEKCAQVFQKFSQVDTSATRKHEGTGLGLSIASSLVKLMGGQIHVKSEVGQGSTFWFEVSLPAEKETRASRHVIPGDLSGARILVVDDNTVNRSILSEQMAAWKFDAAAASSGREGLEIVNAVISNNLGLDLVILDYQMPEMSGVEVLRSLRSDSRTKNIPVVMLTSVDSAETNKQLSELGAEANLTKPTRSSMLLETILQVIANSRASIQMDEETGQETEPQDEQPVVEETPVPVEEDLIDVLVAEDNEVNQIVFTQILNETGLRYKIVENGRLAVAAYKVRKPKMILMDVSMPEMNGKEATIAIRKFEKENGTRRTPIVGVTAHALKGDMEACIDAGMDDYLSKPVSPNKLTRKIEQWLKIDLKTAIG
ncbi:MAG: PAS-domain containing protein [Pseudomonadota bacterium]